MVEAHIRHIATRMFDKYIEISFAKLGEKDCELESHVGEEGADCEKCNDFSHKSN